MFRDPLVLDVLFLLHIGKGLISTVSLSVVVHPKPYEVFSMTELATILGRFLVISFGDFFQHSMCLNCSDFSISELGLGACFPSSV